MVRQIYTLKNSTKTQLEDYKNRLIDCLNHRDSVIAKINQCNHLLSDLDYEIKQIRNSIKVLSEELEQETNRLQRNHPENQMHICEILIGRTNSNVRN
ncbi:hypothetical protein IMX26_13080 [Clostridium sp. 'deep sea']|uniref:hypothetical protein n=1 Tax=Clostridium sp. 'deep sea' TaxID=2779445 RepID=UPI001896856C|nr:hypothetical protein [Clostridium sp. 'deep sea']QOR34419.1 hypothetical protein IMX26_13080 [Clostridium sp. 'deep sea']